MTIRFISGHSSAEYSGELRDEIKKLASRKVLRFLDAASFSPYAAAARVYLDNPVCEPEHVALYTVSGWDGDMPDQPFVPDGTVEEDARLSRHILEDANPVVWLRMLSNNALCQVSIAEGFRGPNAHFVGGAHALGHAVAVATADLRSGAAKLALVVAFDPAEEHREFPSGRAPTSAAAVSLALGDGADATAALFAHIDMAAARNESALSAMETCLSELRAGVR
jgi:3-oxoacyl-(acyl-carrier-protein) synthase